MDDDICPKFVVLRTYLPDNSGESSSGFFEDSNSLNKYCPNKNCNTDLDKITAGFLWLLEQYCSISQKENYDESNINLFFLYIISWLSYKLNQNSKHNFTTINDFYTKHVNDNHKYNNFINDASKFKNLKETIDKKKDFLDINIYDMAKFYDSFKFLCSMHGNVAMGNYDEKLSNNAIHFFNKYTDINDYYNVEGTPHSQILSALLTDYNKLKTNCASKITNPKKFPSLPTGRATKSFLRNSSIQISVIPMTFIFCALLIYLGIVYKRSSFDFRKRLQKLNLRIKKIKRKINH
ncbi:PIR protein [Plasmodium yoelii]|uniref:PIR protein n=2 Tax=Plasmodium yoelii TaxID=5861 RepID=A0AAE9WLN7_PLAYO|nr:PIR protein [Plasmodium yoelii]WBY54654.1 PIR protein [Plasmodium yoelii yoelii]CDU16023.1 YIR protein [Plasmodium yoelii]VTZ71647.1 PIR protein [Plasmodium yoelii]|eukprot:XP_022810972.1 PIR protein [Plasmodium yoelii]